MRRKAGLGKVARRCLSAARQIRRPVERKRSDKAKRLATATYLVSSGFLREAYRYLVRDTAEEMSFVTGPETAGYRVLGQLVEFEKTTRTPGGVTGDPRSTHRALISLAETGHRLLAWVHSHPGYGPGATKPSGTDLAHQARLERGGYPAIGLIASRDGYVRFFSKDISFALHVTGTDVRKVDERIYQLELE